MSVGDHPRVRADQRSDAARGDQGALGVEATGQPLPLLAVAEEGAQRGDLGGLTAGGQRLTDPVTQAGGALDMVTDAHPVHRGDPGRARRPGPDLRVAGLG
jgi:hypothetical protein